MLNSVLIYRINIKYDNIFYLLKKEHLTILGKLQSEPIKVLGFECDFKI